VLGEGVAFEQITSNAEVHSHGIELDAYRAERARSVTNEVIRGNCFDVQCPVESFSLIYLNSVYDLKSVRTDRSAWSGCSSSRCIVGSSARRDLGAGHPHDSHPGLQPDPGISIPRRSRLPLTEPECVKYKQRHGGARQAV
jgi:hypothetical protein